MKPRAKASCGYFACRIEQQDHSVTTLKAVDTNQINPLDTKISPNV